MKPEIINKIVLISFNRNASRPIEWQSGILSKTVYYHMTHYKLEQKIRNQKSHIVLGLRRELHKVP
jgi:hypothetical protein